MHKIRRKGGWGRGLIAALAAVAALGVTAAYTLGGFSASIGNSTSTFSSATIQLDRTYVLDSDGFLT